MKMSNRRNPYSLSDFSLRRLLLQGARAARGSPQLGTRLCDVERGSVKYDKSHPSTSGSNGSNKNNTDSMSQHSASTLTTSVPTTSQRTSTGSPLKNGAAIEECPLCYHNVTLEDFYTLLACSHVACRNCLERYLVIEILESRTDIDCPQCSDSMHPSDIQALLQNHQEVIKKYEDFMVRRVLLTDPDSRWCPAPDCSYAVIATGCASCPRIKCERPGCDINFCYHCKAEWHPDQTCDAARASRQSPIRAPSGSISQDSQHRDDIKPCPRCQVLIVKMDDGSCNHMVCAVCGSEFCWLCMKVISDLHYLSIPSGCTFWGKKPWSRKKKLLWQLGTLIGAPVGVALVAGIAVPAMIIGIPVWIGRKIHTRYRLAGKHKRNCAVLSGVAASNNTDSMSQHSASTLTTSVPTTSQRTSTGSPLKNGAAIEECPLCYHNVTLEDFYTLLACSHVACRNCLERYLVIEILESRTDIDCPQCSDSMHPSDIRALLQNHQEVIKKYEDFMVRRVLLTDPDSRWCPAPDCSYAVIATGCASCPRIKCERPGCDINFCYHCKVEWHPDQTCDAARASRQSPIRAPSGSISQDSQHRDDIKPCPRCQVLIVKMDDGSCNHMVCAVCGSEFCWLCMKVISDLHYLSIPSGCTFWGKKPWSWKKKLLWQLGTLIGAPVGVALVAGIAVPAMIIGIPVWIGRKIHTRYRLAGKHKRNCAVLSGVAASVLVSPVLAGLAVAIGVPILLFYVYGVVPVSLCRAGCGVSTTRDGFKFDFDEEEIGSRHQDASSRIGATSIGEVSLSVASGSHLGMSSGQNVSFGGITHSNRESTMALAGSITGHRLEVQADISSSETASAVTCVSEKSGNTLHDTASTRALAGSILSYKQQMDSSNLSEDGMSERMRYSQGSGQNDSMKDYIWTTLPSDQDYVADKASLSSGKSQRSTDIDTASVSSAQKRVIPLVQRISKLHSTQHRNASVDGSSNAAEQYEPEPDSCSITKTKLSDKLNDKIIYDLNDKRPMPSCSSKTDVTTSTTLDGNCESSSSADGAIGNASAKSLNKNFSKAAILRNLFFSQYMDGGSNSKS